MRAGWPQRATPAAVAQVVMLGDRREMIDLSRPRRTAREPERTDPAGGEQRGPILAVRGPVVPGLIRWRPAPLRLRHVRRRRRTEQPHHRQRTHRVNLGVDVQDPRSRVQSLRGRLAAADCAGIDRAGSRPGLRLSDRRGVRHLPDVGLRNGAVPERAAPSAADDEEARHGNRHHRQNDPLHEPSRLPRRSPLTVIRRRWRLERP